SDPQLRKLLTYHREGDNKILYDLACAYEVVRDSMTAEQRARVETAVLQRMLDDILLEPIYTYDHNNVYQWHRAIVQTALALERDDLVDWSFGFGAYDAEHQPEHRSMRRLLATHFKPDGAYWEMCSGYHLYPVSHLCEFAVLSHNLSAMDPVRFPPEQYDLTNPASEWGAVIARALHWFMSMAMPNRKMPTIGDSTQPIAGMDDYFVTAEVGYRFYDLRSVGDYPAYREGNRNWVALLYGADRIEQHKLTETSSYLSSGWVSLRNTCEGNPAWVGLNALIPGGGHQHADRLGLLFYSQGELLALEKATPYNESVTRVLGTLSPMHNTVSVDVKSQPQGEALTEEQVPSVERFYASDWLQFAELEADHLYPQTSAFRRSVAMIEDVVLDCFVVEGGETHDWMLHHGGEATALSIPMAEGTFEPTDWLYNGTGNIKSGATDASWEARWQVGDVNARLTMAGAANTEVFALETYPIANAVITKDDPPCQTLCVRRRDDVPFLAVWDAWKDDPSVRDVRFVGANAVYIATESHVYYVCFGPGTVQFDDGVSMTTDAAFTAVQDAEAATIVGGQHATMTFPDGTITVAAEETVTCTVTRSPSGAEAETFPSIQFDTYQGENHPRPRPEVTVDVGGTLWK
ncbi:MAG: heparinase II/III family protein, partial [Candidatus Hydrogenedentes bacterium]|nr:heparinase II/III family protein [Candidatus Hydrogenedentota bacterium]